MPLFSRHGDPMLDQIARDTFSLFPRCHRCGVRIEQFEDADVRVLMLRVVHRGTCPGTLEAERAGAPTEHSR